MIESHWEIALYLSLLGDIVHSELPVGSRCILCFCRLSTLYHSGECGPSLRNAQCADES